MKQITLISIIFFFYLSLSFAQEAGITNPANGLTIHRYNFDTYITGTRTCAFDGWANPGNIDIRLYVNGSLKSFDCNNCGTWNTTQDIDAGTNNIYLESREDFDSWVASSHRSITFMKPLNASDFYLTNPDDTYIKITWYKHTSDGTAGFYYRVCRNTIDEVNSGDDWVVLGEWTQVNTYSDYTVEIGETYFYWVVCASDNAGSNPSAFGTSRQTESPFPVELTTFTAKVIKNSVLLNWHTATEINNYGFEIESKTEYSNWHKIGFIQGHGNSNSPKDYLFFVENVFFEKNHYRLKQIDFDGNYEYSYEIESNIVSLLELSLNQNYPNPFNPFTQIDYSIPREGFVSLKVYDILGKEISTLVNENRLPGNYKIEFDGSKLSSGVYFYKLQLGNQIINKKMLLIE